MKILVTGGAGFIGSHFVRHFLRTYPAYTIVNLDKLSYAGNLENLSDLHDNPRHRFVRGDICDEALVARLSQETDAIIHFAAETHVDRSIVDAGDFIKTNISGTHVLLEASRRQGHRRFVHISTDEVYGSCASGSFSESAALCPSSPYSASKAGSDLLVTAYHKTYGLPAIITRCTNNYGPFQFPEKFVPLMIANALDGKALPVYGDGLYVRDWLYVLDHCEAIDRVFHHGRDGEIYNIGAQGDQTNLDVIALLLKFLNEPEARIEHVRNRQGHDRRYAVNPEKIQQELGWEPRYSFEAALKETARWYQAHQSWWKNIQSGDYLKMYEKIYGTAR